MLERYKGWTHEIHHADDSRVEFTLHPGAKPLMAYGYLTPGGNHSEIVTAVKRGLAQAGLKPHEVEITYDSEKKLTPDNLKASAVRVRLTMRRG